MLPPKPANTVFGIQVDGRRKGISFSSLPEARQAAAGHAAKSGDVVIFDQVTGETVERIGRPAPAPG